MNWLERLKNEKAPDTYPAKPAEPSNAGFAGSIPGPFVNIEAETEGSAGFAGSISGHIENSMMAAMVVLPVPDWATDPANDSTVDAVSGVAFVGPPPDPERWCWPHSDAMTGREVDTFTGRLKLFTAKGLTLNDAEVLADKLLIRDREGDDRRVCLECSHLSGWSGRRQCRGLQYAGMGGPLVSAGQVTMPQRCNGFKGTPS